MDEWSFRRRVYYLTTHNTHKSETAIHLAGFELTTSASERPQTHVLDCAATGIGTFRITLNKCKLSVSGEALSMMNTFCSPLWRPLKSNLSPVPRSIVDSYSTLPGVMWEAVTVVEGIPWWGLLRHTLANGAPVYARQGGRFRAEGCMALG